MKFKSNLSRIMVSRLCRRSQISTLILSLIVSIAFIYPASAGEKPPAPFTKQFSSKHLDIYWESEDDCGQEYSAFLEDFLFLVNKHFAPIAENWHLKIYLYRDEAELNRAESGRGRYENIVGRYVETENCVYSHEHGGFGTMGHEVMHKIISDNFKYLEPWAKEGIPAFFEKIYEYRDKSEQAMFVGYQNPWRLKNLGSDITRLDLRKIYYVTGIRDETGPRMLATFLAYEGKLDDYFYLAEKGDAKGYATILEAAFRDSLIKMQPKFAAFTKAVFENEDVLLKVPSSQYFRTKTDYVSFAAKHPELAKQPLPSLANRKYATTPHDGIRQLYMRVNDTYQKKQYRQCILETDKCLALYPDDLGMLIVRSRIFALTGKNDAAFTDVCSAIKILPNSGDLLTLRALLEARKGQKQNAYNDLVIAYNLDKTSPSTNLNMGEILLQLDRFNEAAPYLEYAVKNSNGYGEPYYYRSLLYKKMGRLKEAEVDLRTSRKLKYVPGTDTLEAEPRR